MSHALAALHKVAAGHCSPFEVKECVVWWSASKISNKSHQMDECNFLSERRPAFCISIESMEEKQKVKAGIGTGWGGLGGTMTVGGWMGVGGAEMQWVGEKWGKDNCKQDGWSKPCRGTRASLGKQLKRRLTMICRSLGGLKSSYRVWALQGEGSHRFLREGRYRIKALL